jgi:hypothetical protein
MWQTLAFGKHMSRSSIISLSLILLGVVLILPLTMGSLLLAFVTSSFPYIFIGLAISFIFFIVAILIMLRRRP